MHHTLIYHNVSSLFLDFCFYRIALINELKLLIDNSTARWRVFVPFHISINLYISFNETKIFSFFFKEGNSLIGKFNIIKTDQTRKTERKNLEENQENIKLSINSKRMTQIVHYLNIFVSLECRAAVSP